MSCDGHWITVLTSRRSASLVDIAFSTFASAIWSSDKRFSLALYVETYTTFNSHNPRHEKNKKVELSSSVKHLRETISFCKISILSCAANSELLSPNPRTPTPTSRYITNSLWQPVTISISHEKHKFWEWMPLGNETTSVLATTKRRPLGGIQFCIKRWTFLVSFQGVLHSTSRTTDT